MSLIKYKLGELIKKYDQKCGVPNLTANDISGINRDKEFFEPSRQVGKDTSNYKIVPVNFFATNLMHVGRDVVLPVALNHSNQNKIVSPAYTIFRVINHNIVLNEYLFMYLNSEEKDRYFWFFTDASIRDGLSWKDFCELEIPLPSLEIQKKYVDLYKAFVVNKETYEDGLEDLMLACSGTIDRVKHFNKLPLSLFVKERNERNINNEVRMMKGIGLQGFIEPNQKRSLDSQKKCKIFYLNDFVYAPSSLKDGVIWLNQKYSKAICSEEYICFYNIAPSILNSDYLLLLLKRSEFLRFIEFNSIDSVRNRFYFNDIKEIEIPVPDIKIQNSIARMYDVYRLRKEINEKLKTRIKNLCPILIKGAMEEAARVEGLP